ncbi:NAD(P)H-dependent glycerol-3-phosphate dehydrogenase [Rhizobium leguminosarum]|uniref:NAD(P)H-dependent glycerol-3-phosphate dehydrogenase n=1 Tax=Rhizobium leguminosarum TaxID=384 RepID=UPI00103CC573|nr:glycerol-3-phosphate dehydrogenase [Rhizobium leguminosarum]NKK96045.1 glycerol-3-phosphate dehydrogenase [Rhizobium leguminosarum bv. viciae]TBY23633.1 glycerol-3-phosphate dehydrogenase [Rhizobium leguminosarum bv. viciae]TBY26785.1 glycerol-3-phosphate dehydrogenase [Rhizobium leguminosarum bv. viciae]TBY99490.1 glycerol-3-phosphate dehydrogenase [Rhizobium leguminosarum bv. viciae]
MAKIVVLGAGVMGTALCVPAADNGHKVLLVGTPLDQDIVVTMRRPGGIHPKLDAAPPAGVEVIRFDELRSEHLANADIIVVGVSSPGIGWVTDILNWVMTEACPIAFVTKGLESAGSAVSTYAQTLPSRIPLMSAFIGIGGPCIARELANRLPTACIYACEDISVAEQFAAIMQTDYYRLSVTTDVTGVEACAALKNFYAIGVSAMQTGYPDQRRADGQSKNPTAAVFTQATLEMARLCERLGGQTTTAFGLAGLGDLHVTVGGGRNSRLGQGLGTGRTVVEMLSSELFGETVEGVDTARVLANMALEKQHTDEGPLANFPLATAIMDAVLQQKRFSLDFSNLIVQ